MSAPRTRGGQSGPRYSWGRRCRCSPHTRGSVVTLNVLVAVDPVLPAHAGVSRRQRLSQPQRAGAPRTRGGQSTQRHRPRRQLPCSPHTRGSVGRRMGGRDDRAVLPAHAGVSRTLLAVVDASGSAPRTRGGQSWTTFLTDVNPDVLPAHAGVSRLIPPPLSAVRGAPRTRGGQSAEAADSAVGSECSPHTRGSVVSGCRERRRFAVLPAHAGVSHGPRPATRSTHSAPRTRGGQS